MPQLNTPQRILLACTGVAIFFFQFYRFSEDGVEGYGWVFSFLIGALLLLPAVGLLSKGNRGTPISVPATPPSSSDRLERAKQRVESLASRAVEQGKVLHRQLPLLLDLPPLQSAELKGINEFMIDSWLQYCIAYSGALSLMAEWKREPRFPKQHEYELVRTLLIGEMVKAEAGTAAKNGLKDKYNFERSMKFATEDFNQGEAAMRKFADRLANSVPSPDAPMIDFLIEKIGAPEQSRPSLTQGLERFTKEALRKFSTGAA